MAELNPTPPSARGWPGFEIPNIQHVFAIAMVLVVSALPAQAREVTVKGLGNRPCSEWTQAHQRRNSSDAVLQDTWLAGFVSAFNAWGLKEGKDVAPGLGLNDIVSRISNYCFAHPSDTLFKAAALFIRDLQEVPPVASTPTPAPPVASTPTPAPSSAKQSTGSGYAIDDVGDVVTDNHVVAGCQTLTLRHGERVVPAELVASDDRNDLAVVKGALPDLLPIKFRDGKGIRAGDAVIAMGYPYAGLLAITPQTTTGTVMALAGVGDDSRMLQVTAPIQPGNSGGLLFDLKGNVVGTIVATLNALAMAKATGSIPQNVNFATKSGIVRDFLDSKGLNYQTSASTVTMEPADVAEAGAKSVVMVECTK
jgi:S1-C subfamily serine protease